MALIELKRITKTFGKGDAETTALAGIDLSIKEGEFVAIVGPSGSGKSTLMNILGLLDIPTTGEYHLEGQAVRAKKETALAKLRREQIGFVFQNFNLIPRLNLLQNVELPMIYSGLSLKARRERAKQLLNQVGLSHRVKSRTNQISGGELQRAAIARALANQPSLILADEPTGNLDTQNSAMVIDQLKDLHKAGATVVMITHNPEIATSAQRTITMRDGKIVKPARSKK